MIVNRQTFFDLQDRFQYVPFDQTEEWLDSLYSDESTALFFVDSIEEPLVCCWGTMLNRRFIGEHLFINGISVEQTVTSEKIRKFYGEIISEKFSIIELSDIGLYDADYEVGVRRAGFIRPLGFSLSPLTIIIKLQEPFTFHRNWRRNTKKSIEQGVTFKHIDKPTTYEAEMFVDLFDELKERKQLGFSLTPNALMKLFDNGRYLLFFAQDKDRVYLAGRVVYVCGAIAYDVYAANSNRATKCGAAYFLQEEIFKYLKNNGLKTFDYGRIPAGTDHMDGIYVAKSYSGGIPALYNGQWQYSKSNLLDYINSFYRHCIHKKKRY